MKEEYITEISYRQNLELIIMRRKGELAFLEKDEDKDLKQRMFIAKFNEEISTLGKILEAELAKEERDYQDSKE
jgi:hypothetical protein